SDFDIGDILLFRSRFNLPGNEPQKVLVGPDPGKTGSQSEAMLDMEWAGGIARNATIIYVYARSADTARRYAIDQNLAPVISVSFSAGCEALNSDAFRASQQASAQQANAQGITWVNSSGDGGAAGCDNNGSPRATRGFGVRLPESTPEVTAVGGTTFSEG